MPDQDTKEEKKPDQDYLLVQDKDIHFHADREDDYDYRISDDDNFDLW